MHCLACFLHVSEACTCLSFQRSTFFPAVLATCSKVTCWCFAFSSPYCMSLSGAMFYAVWMWTNERVPSGTAARSYSWHFTIMNSHRRRIPKAEMERKEEEGGKKEGRGNVIELPWKISITYLLNQLYEVLSEKRPFGLQTIVSTARFHATFVYEPEIDLWRREKKRMKWRICVVIDPMAVLVRMHTIGQMWNPYYLI